MVNGAGFVDVGFRSVRRKLIHKVELNEVAGSRVLRLSSDSRCRGSVPVSSVQKSVQLRGVCVSGVGELGLLRVSSEFASSQFLLRQCELRQSPRKVLALAMQELRRAAEAKKGMRIAKRLALLAEGKPERVRWSSQKSLRGVC